MTDYRNLDVYKEAYELYLQTTRLSLKFPYPFDREIGSQLRRAALSIILNIAEGYGRKDSTLEFQHFLRNSLGSANEVKVLLEISHDLALLTNETYQSLSERYEIVGKKLFRLRLSWKGKNNQPKSIESPKK